MFEMAIYKPPIRSWIILDPKQTLMRNSTFRLKDEDAEYAAIEGAAGDGHERTFRLRHALVVRWLRGSGHI